MEVKSKRTEILWQVNDWKYEIEERTGEWGTQYRAWRVGVYEKAGKTPRLLAICGTFEEAQAAAKKTHGRSLRGLWGMWGMTV